MNDPRSRTTNSVDALTWLVGVALLFAPLGACKSTSAATGSEGGACYKNGTCDGALSCLSNLCVNAAPADAAAGDGASGHASGDASDGPAGSGGGAAGAKATGVAGASGGASGGAGAGVAGRAGVGSAGQGGAGAGGGPAGDRADASTSDGDAGANTLELPPVAPSHLQLWLTADRELKCASGEVTMWLDQSGKGRDATRGAHKGPECPTSLHSLAGVGLPYFSALGASPPFNDQTLDIDLAFLTNTDYTIFVVERRWADRPTASGKNEMLIGTDVPDPANTTCPSAGFQINLGYVFYDGVPALDYESLCYSPYSGTRGRAPATPSSPPAPTSYDMLRLAQSFGASPTVWQDGVKINAGAASGGLGAGFTGGAIGRALSSATDNRFQGDIAEIVIFDAAVSDAEAQMMADYFKKHWRL